MSLNKAIQSGKEHRQPYRKSKAFDYSCHNHKSCGWCYGNRTHSTQKRIEAAKDREKNKHDS